MAYNLGSVIEAIAEAKPDHGYCNSNFLSTSYGLKVDSTELRSIANNTRVMNRVMA